MNQWKGKLLIQSVKIQILKSDSDLESMGTPDQNYIYNSKIIPQIFDF